MIRYTLNGTELECDCTELANGQCAKCDRINKRIINRINEVKESIQKPSYADQLFSSLWSESHIFDSLSDRWSFIDDIGWDHYDSSLEIYCDSTAPADWEISKEEAEIIWSWGFAMCWLNFADGTQQYIGPKSHGKRKPCEFPRYPSPEPLKRRDRRAVELLGEVLRSGAIMDAELLRRVQVAIGGPRSLQE